MIVNDEDLDDPNINIRRIGDSSATFLIGEGVGGATGGGNSSSGATSAYVSVCGDNSTFIVNDGGASGRSAGSSLVEEKPEGGGNWDRKWRKLTEEM